MQAALEIRGCHCDGDVKANNARGFTISIIACRFDEANTTVQFS